MTAPMVVAAPTGLGEFTGYASTWTDAGGPDRQGDTVAFGAYAEAVQAINTGRRAVPLLAGDDHSDWGAQRVVGRIAEAHEDNIGLWVRGVFAADPFSQEIRAKVASGALSMSIFGPVLKSLPTATGRQLVTVDLIHVLLTSIPANTSAIVLSAKAAPGTSYAEVVTVTEHVLREARKRDPNVAARRVEDMSILQAGLPAWILQDAELRSQALRGMREAALAKSMRERVADPGRDARQRRYEQANRYSTAVAEWNEQHRTHRRCRTNGDCDE